MKVYVSPTITDDLVSKPLTFEWKVKLFHDRFRGWKFEIAHRMLEGYQSKDGTAIPPIPTPASLLWTPCFLISSRWGVCACLCTQTA